MAGSNGCHAVNHIHEKRSRRNWSICGGGDVSNGTTLNHESFTTAAVCVQVSTACFFAVCPADDYKSRA